ncbi:hypothetical protein ACQUZK_09980, partial [Streptococcus pyogenes]|uniref:hypothetical protein n=1 Tax=Streptococcus pyogenes TaxID=1314 RepID=UPI003DA039E4
RTGRPLPPGDLLVGLPPAGRSADDARDAREVPAEPGPVAGADHDVLLVEPGPVTGARPEIVLVARAAEGVLAPERPVGQWSVE